MNKKNIIISCVIAAVFSLLTVLLSPLSEKLTDSTIDILFKLRGSRSVSEDMVFIYIDSRDLEELNQWPITRDYYGYLTFILKRAGAKVVGLDIVFTSKNARYPEYDDDFSQFLRTSQNVCLPFAFRELSDTFVGRKQSFLLGNEPQFPIEMFRQYSIGTGFTNLLDETIVRRCALAALHDDSVYFSFGAELARLYKFGTDSEIQVTPHKFILKNKEQEISVSTDRFSRIRLNHFGTLDNIRSMSLVDLFQTYQNDADKLDLQDKLVLVGFTALGRAPFKMTPYHSSFPAALLHFTVAENILNNSFIRTTPLFMTVLILFASTLLPTLSIPYRWRSALIFFTALVAYVLIALTLFKRMSIALPLLYPLFAVVTSSVVLFISSYRNKSRSEKDLHTLYHEQIANKQQQLENAQAGIKEMRTAQEKLSSETRQSLEEKQREILRLEKELRDLQKSPEGIKVAVGKYAQIIHAPSSKMVSVLQLVEKVSPDDIPVLISGETGTGKEVIARAIHDSGGRKSKEFVAVNCGALPETLLESELFGHERGAFTGATSQRKGRFELADGGTLFLDEITETTAAFQAKLLRVLQEGTFERLGSEKTLKVDVRIIAASSKNIEKQVDAELFRQDLYYRLNGFPIELPPLRERRDDIPLLARHFLHKHGYESITAFSERALEAMLSFGWPGNVRELENTVRRAAILAQSDGRKMIQEIDLPRPIQENAQEELQIKYQSLDEQILETLRSLSFSHSSISQTAQALGNKDRGTITEYFRGLCFEQLVRSNFDLDAAAAALAATDEQTVLEKVKSKISEYVGKVQTDPASKSLYKGLPKKYHSSLEKIISYLRTRGNIIK